MNQPSISKNAERIFSIIGLSIIIIIAVIVLVIKPQISNLKTTNLKTAVKQNEYDLKQEKLTNLKELEKKIPAAQEKVTKLAIALPKGAKPEEMLVQAAAMATNAGIGIKSISMSQTATAVAQTTSQTSEEDAGTAKNTTTGSKTTKKSTPQIATLTLSISLSGNYSQFQAFLKNMETNLRPITVKTFSLNPNSNSKNAADPSLDASLQIDTIYQQ